ncbi:MAG: S8 family serine peptidase [Bacteroidetes bacterium]|nr:S8 family serine peptidase [Bacteroidota bacterium]
MPYYKYLLSIIMLSYSVTAQTVFTPAVDSRRPVLPLLRNEVSSDSIVHVIVEFNEQPLFLVEQHSFAKVSPLSYEQRFIEFTNDLQSFSVKSNSPAVRSASTVHRQFYHSFFGISIDLPYGMIAAVERLPYVKKVHENRPVSASLHKSVPQIRANEVWSKYNVTGEGIVVGIIDTGIDYLHPALGGGIGSTFKVIGGYDFANNDTDPMDDHGHGTHVAGIVAADDAEVKGVAPKAKLYAFKVLNANGGGNTDDVIAAIERTVDPNNDGNMDDKLDVVNMSLGSHFGNPDDAASVAVDNATMLGITFAIAAGNSGLAEIIEGKENNFFYTGMETIGSPGTSRLAITVGAIDSVNKLAYFSSKGPAGPKFEIKPDVLAPGVFIRSLAPGNSYLIESGTSMAAPMIAGVAALLKSANHALTPAQIKSMIVNSSVDLGMKPMLQGGGKVDAMRAMALSSYAVPSHLSYGLDEPSQTTWTKVETVKVGNGKNVSQQYTVSFTGGATGITLSAAPSNFTVAAGGVQTVLVTLAVNNVVIPIVDDDIVLHDGVMHIRSETDTLRLPWSFARTTRMTLTFSHPDPFFVGSGFLNYLTPNYHKMYSRIRWMDLKNVEITGAAKGLYDFGIFYHDASVLVLKEGLQFNGSDTFAFDAAEAVHAIHFEGVDNTAVPFGTSEKMKRSVRVNLPIGFLYASLQTGSKVLMVSPASAQFEFQPIEALLDIQSGKRVVLPQYASFKGLSSDVHVTNASATFFHQTLRFVLPDGVIKTRFFSDVISSENILGEYYYNTVLFGADTVDAPEGEIVFDLYMMKTVDPKYSSSIAFHTNSSYLKDYYLDMSTRYFSIVNDSLLMGFPSQELATSYKSPNGATLNFGESPLHIFNQSYNNAFGPSIHFNPMFFGSLFESRYSDLNTGMYTIYDASGSKLVEEPLNNFPRFPYSAELGKYSVVMSSRGYSVKNVKGTVTLRNDFDLSKTVPDAPAFTSFRILNTEGRVLNNITQNEKATLLFSSKVFSFPFQVPVTDSTKAFYRKFKTAQWIPLTVTPAGSDAEKEGEVFTVSLAPATAVDSVAIDLKIRVVDSYGNAADQILSPAFSVGNWIDDGTTDAGEDTRSVPSVFALHQNFPNPFNPLTIIQYEVPYSGPVQLKVYDVLGREVSTIVNEYKTAGRYLAEFNAGNLSSGLYFCRLSAGQQHAIRKMMLVQ